MRELSSASADCILTDPPYGIRYRTKRNADQPNWKRRITNDESPFIWWLHEAYRVLKDGGCLVCFCRWDVEDVFRMAIRAAAFAVRSQIVWDKECHSAGDTRATFAPQHENLIFATKGRFAFPHGRPRSVMRVKRVSGCRESNGANCRTGSQKQSGEPRLFLPTPSPRGTAA